MAAVVLTAAPVARPPLTGLDPTALPTDRHAVAVYLASHAPKNRLAVDAVEVLATMAPALKTIIHHRQLFASSMIDGRTVGELDPVSTAAEEITALWPELTTHFRIDGKE